MSASLAIDPLFMRTREISDRINTERNDLRSAAIAAIRMIEQKLQVAIDGDILRGMTNIARRGSGEFYAASIVPASFPHGVDTFIPIGKEVLVISQDGVFESAILRAGGFVARSPVTDDDLYEEDLEDIVIAVESVLKRHLVNSTREAENLSRLSKLADMLTTFL